MKEYKVEIAALKLITVKANNPKEALNKIKNYELHCETTENVYYGDDLEHHFHYEDCDFKKAKITEE